ncbi:hypothetical protein H6G20_11115 [Desertifilum sp. FACHB-1129]|uniref:Glycosyltransferase RgtA/B/C/D-like domain-containing protein n=1 Tax=Desertifilum tharense IPPAS B-1220 TaxID=1781255 RepID=A0A1E5QR59_9CYAN|nr:MULTISPECIES: hypothetical protein [Desertifilum]MDA0210726.1 hypothetical protein [Cyanobacteria bacterium FC1]MBD2312212.1 hypothetical protein [Desertifilum sp. FACHB-1129]MBD2323721.1 hypothetical protein [Desertifilum sp. FACHB-866]MBD2332418.1 hypothetical protein [Desertifilum sp. FACHB-868]OEJ77101.1 hypothetical protein BH720_01340 [Desertifilum tharense IPPAS B-1220]
MILDVKKKSIKVNLILFSLLVLIAVTIPTLYVLSERTFYVGDFSPASYHQRVVNMTRLFQASPRQAVEKLTESLTYEQNHLFTLPSVPFLWILGNHRLVYIISVALLYLIPLSLVLGVIATKIISFHPQAVFWTTAFLTFSLPTTWLPTLRGYPDAGGALILVLATWTYLHNRRLKFIWQIIIIGILLALAMIFRRHFAYGSLAFISAIILQIIKDTVLTLHKSRKIASYTALNPFLKVGLVGLVSLGFLSIVATPFFQRIAQTNYTRLYASFSLSLSDSIQLYGSTFGWGVWCLVLVGIFLGLFTQKNISSSQFEFIALTGFCSIFFWVFKNRYDSIQYTLHITPLIILSIAVLIWSIQASLEVKNKSIILLVLGLLLAINFVSGITAIGKIQYPLRFLFAKSYPPIVRTDHQEVSRLVDYLRTIASQQQTVYIIPSGDLLSLNLIHNAERDLYGRKNAILNLVITPKFDSRDEYPLEGLLKSEYVVFSTPLHHRLKPSEEKVVKVVFDAFRQNQEFTQDFQRLPVEFFLEQDTVVSIYQRIRPTAIPVAIRMLDWMQAQIGDRPGSQLDWIILGQPFPSGLQKNPDNSYRIFTHPADRFPNPTASFLYIGELSPITQIRGEVKFADSQCIGTTLQFSTVDAEGTSRQVIQQQFTPHQDGKFTLSLPTAKARYLQMDVLNYQPIASVNHCTLEVNALHIQTD